MDYSPPRNPSDDEEGITFQPRRNGRVALNRVTQMRIADQGAVEVNICDISASGFRADCRQPVLIGSYVSVDLPGIGPVHAHVRWQVGGRLGARFLDPVNLRRCDWLVARD